MDFAEIENTEIIDMNETVGLDKGFIRRQRNRLVKDRNELLGIQIKQVEEEGQANEEFSGQARTYEDDAQRLATLELESQLSAANRLRLQTIDRAIKKIEEGTYGLSDQSHRPIPIERLEAVPEALLTLDEQTDRDGNGH